MIEKISPAGCYHYDRDDWLKIDVNTLLAPWVDHVAEIYQIGKKPAKYIVTYALASITVPHAQEIMDTALAIFDEPATFQKRYGMRLAPPLPDVSTLMNLDGISPSAPRQVNFMDLVNFWAMPINRTLGMGIVQCRDVVKIALTFFLVDHFFLLAQAIEALVNTPDHELFLGEGKIIFQSLQLVCTK